ncbi:MAG: flagellar motor switch protein FliG [Bacteroidetes bacterium]|nr:flagellar motor switch protein FliG [Rhodothermia bacterium]MCS7154665.1 flagellar motor switch protein FliG [Bacteroidota bacterium]MCX7906382.1 flagellar motor switch protein FliG [Bacteroidota bacterium]MDW8137458.1 flagellar motor switch protein FliG [Bacteroidota bacterium]MDW8285588.1 flagellar motor switch protein FliG [Bacteroidota bacterium]
MLNVPAKAVSELMAQTPSERSDAKLSGAQKAAIILVSMGVETAAQILKKLSEEEVERITLEIARIASVTPEMIDAVVTEYHQMMTAKKYVLRGGLEFAMEVLERIWGRKKAEEIIMRIEAATKVSAFYLLQTVETAQLVNFIQSEHPQVAALILAKLNPHKAADVLSNLPPDLQGEITYRLATMGKTPPELIHEIEEVIRSQMGNIFGSKLSETGGPHAAAAILNLVSRQAERHIMGVLLQRDPEVAEKIKSLMFTFEDILGLPDQAIQRILAEIDTRQLAIALRGASEDLRQKFKSNMSQRAAEMLEEEMTYLGPVRVRDVEEAQNAIVRVIRQLEEAEEIVISRGGQEEYI